jgi:hypothetical protein
MSTLKAVLLVYTSLISPATTFAGEIKPQIVNSENATVHADFKSKPYWTDPTRILYCELKYNAWWDEEVDEYHLAITYGVKFPPATEKQVPIHFLSSFLSKTDSKEIETVIPLKRAYVGTSDDSTLAKDMRSHEVLEQSSFTEFDSPSVFLMTAEMSDNPRLYGYILTETDKIIVAEMDFAGTETGMPGDATQAQSFAKCAERLMHQSLDRY